MAGYQDMACYQKSFQMAVMVFHLSKRFPPEEKYSLTDQVRRASRAVSGLYAEGYRKRRYPALFVLRMTDADGENTETQVWLAHAVACDYVTAQEVAPILALCEEIGRMLGDMIMYPSKYCKRK